MIERHVAGRIEADQDGVVRLSVGHAALHRLAAGQSDVKIGQGVAVGRDDDARAAPLSAAHKNGEYAVFGLAHDGDSLRLGLKHRHGRLGRQTARICKQRDDHQKSETPRPRSATARLVFSYFI